MATAMLMNLVSLVRYLPVDGENHMEGVEGFEDEAAITIE